VRRGDEVETRHQVGSEPSQQKKNVSKISKCLILVSV